LNLSVIPLLGHHLFFLFRITFGCILKIRLVRKNIKLIFFNAF
jgi:hypothetical protein